jgi:serine phosphatase RsbU (regulator of sigma subunit)
VSAAFRLVSVGIRILFLVPLVLIVIWGVREQGREGWLALPAVVLVGIVQFQNELLVLHFRTNWFPFGVQLTISEMADLLLVAVLFVLLIRRLLLSIRHQRQLALDVKQAQEVQQVLIPEQLPKVPGLTIESEYRPAREVGGDFFQILPHPSDGSVLIVAGDVTGKGLQAGMLVALIVGAIRATAQYDFDALAILQSLNQRLCGRGHAHATCLALHIGADGAATLANAGHLPPYLNGKAVTMEGALPLGIVWDAQFSLMRFHLGEGDRLMLVSDGIAEAMDAEGRLFGFERVEEMLADASDSGPISAAELAAAAQVFGQADDISVIAITRETALSPVSV